MSRFTVLGAGGFIGSALVPYLREQGHEVFAPARDEAVPYDRDLGHVIYAIGLTADFRSRPFDTVRAHVSLLTEVLERASFASLLYLSSTRVYGKSGIGSESADLTVNAADPSDLYNLSKLMGESICLHGGRSGVRVARLSNVIGLDRTSENFLFELIREARAGRILLRSAPASAKDYILLDEVLALLTRIALGGQQSVYNVASGRAIRNDALCSELARLTGCQVDCVPDAPVLSFPLIDASRIRDEFGWVPRSVLQVLPTLVSAF